MEEQDVLRWIKAVLSNDEYSTDEEIFDCFCAQGVDPAVAQYWVARRDEFLGAI